LHFLNVTDMRTLFYTDQQIVHARDVIERYKKTKTLPQGGADVLWAAKKVLDTTIHPDTGEKIPLPFRVSAFVPMNTLITFGMLLPGAGLANQVFWQWINQSYNIALNHSNRNASNQLSNQTIAKTYAAAVGVSCGVAVGMSEVVKRAPFAPSMRSILQRIVPFTAVSIAGVVNVFMMRWNETRKGIAVFDKNGNEVGKSKVAGFNALTQVAISRVATSFPCLILPPVIMNYLEGTKLLRNTPVLKGPVNLAVITLTLLTALPASVAIFPQVVQIAPRKLESEFHNSKEEKLYYNKGL